MYDSSSIRVLGGLEAVRHRPAMYIGSTGPQGALHLLLEVVQNSVDEVLAGHCTRIRVEVEGDGTTTVIDDGRGIPLDSIELVLTTLHSGGKFDKQGGYAVSGGLHGVGISCVNALSEVLDVEVRRGRHITQRYARGVPSPAQDKGPTDHHGTLVRWRPDPQIFESAQVDLDAIAQRLEEWSFLLAGLRLELSRPDGTETVYEEEGGLAGFVQRLAGPRALHRVPICLSGRRSEIDVDLVLMWTRTYHEELRSYVNTIHTRHGGTHVTGFQAALTRSVDRYARRSGLLSGDLDEEIAGHDIREGMVAILVVTLPEPQFEGQTKTMLSTTAAHAAVQSVVEETLDAWFVEHPDEAAAVVGKALEASRARAAARRASERARYQAVDTSLSKDIYRKQFGIRSANWHDSCVWLTDESLLGAHAEMCKMPEDARVLDICCGSGVVGASFRDRVGHIEGLDLTPEMIALAETRLDHVTKGDVYEIPFDEGSFDLVCNREVLHLLPRPERPVAQVFRVLRPGGQFVFGQLVPYGPVDAPWFFRILKKKQPLFFNNFLAEDLVVLLENAGFANIETSELTVWEDIDLWIETHETPSLQRHEIRRLYHEAPAEVRRVHPFEITPSGRIRDQWRWVICSAFKPE